MHAECPLCGRLLELGVWESYHATDIAEVERQIANLTILLTDVRCGKEKVALLLEEKFEACPLCADILSSIVSDAEKHILEERVAASLVELATRQERLFQSGR